MPNWCNSRFAIIADNNSKKELKRLYDNLNNTMNSKCPQENGFGNEWLGHVAIDNELPWNRLCCRGRILDIDNKITQLNENKDYFIVTTETAWTPPVELFNEILKKYKGLTYKYIAEEEGNEVYINTDITGDIFPERYLFYTEDKGYQYFRTKEELLKGMNEYFNTNFDDIDEIQRYIDINIDEYIEVYKYSEEE